MDYSITIPDIKRYLASLKPEDPAGDTTSSTACLVAQAIQHKYGAREVRVAHYGFAIGGTQYPIEEEEVSGVIWDFDILPGQFPTRAEVEQAIPSLKQEV